MNKEAILTRIARGETITSFEATKDGEALYELYEALQKDGLITFKKHPVKMGLPGLSNISLTTLGRKYVTTN